MRFFTPCLYFLSLSFCFLVAGVSYSQTDSLSTPNSQAVNGEPAAESAQLQAVSDTISFCGCQSTQVVMQCADCFKQAGAVLKTGYELSFESKTVIRGSCWDFANAVYKRAGVSKETIFASTKGNRYAKADLVKPGDWIYHINYDFRNVEHSAIFVCWKDKAKRQAITLSYVGMNRAVPGRLDEADLRSITSIFRAIPH